MVAALSPVWDVGQGTETPLTAAVTVWAVFDALETVPADADDQRDFREARELLEVELRHLGLPIERLRGAVPDVPLLRAVGLGRGDPFAAHDPRGSESR